MDNETRQIVELVQLGLDATGVANVIRAKRLLANGHEPEPLIEEPRSNGHAVQLAIVQPTHPETEAVIVQTVKDLVNETITYEDVHTAPVGTRWSIPFQRLKAARARAKTKSRNRAQAVNAVYHTFKLRGQSDCVRVSCPSGSSHLTIEKVVST